VEVRDESVGACDGSFVRDWGGVRGAPRGRWLGWGRGRTSPLEQLARRLTERHQVSVRVVDADLGQPERLASLAAETAELRIDMLVNNAALAHYMPFVELPVEAAHELIDLNVLAPVLLTKAVLPGMVERGTGAVVNVASLLAFSGSWEAPQLPKRTVYAATKSFLLTFTQVLAAELQETGVRVQVLCPGVVRSEFHTRQGLDMSGAPRMEPGDVVAASLADLERNTVVSIPGATDDTLLETVQEAQQELMTLVRARELPERYRSST
jgi:short-subunit dehydrogenase